MSALKVGVESFLGRFFASSLDNKWRTPADFLRHFGPTELIAALTEAPQVRARLLVEAAGVHVRIAAKKSAESAIEDLTIALDEGIATPEMIVGLFPADDQARYLPRAKAWSYLTEEPFWSDGRADSVARVTFVVSAAVEEGLLTLDQVLESLNIDALVDVLPPAELRKTVRFALSLGRDSKVTTELGLLELLSMEKLFGFSALARLWQELIVELVARPCALLEATEAGPRPDPKPTAQGKESRASADKPQASKTPEVVAAVAVELSATPKEFGELFEEVGEDDEFQTEASDAEPAIIEAPAAAPEGSGPPPSGEVVRTDAPDVQSELLARSPQEELSRERAAGRLRSIDRLPPSWESFPTPVLLSVDSMYAELVAASTDEAREEIIRDSFPNESLLRTAMLAVIELLDTTIDTNDPLIADADVDSLIKIVVFEEHLRHEQAAGASASTPSGASRRMSTAPPLPSKSENSRGSSAAPPPLPRPGTMGAGAAHLKKAR